jgi:hypothetical protein
MSMLFLYNLIFTTGNHLSGPLSTFVIPNFASKTKYSSHLCPGSFIPHMRT